MSNQLPPLDKCCDCQKSFSKEERHRAIRKESKPVMNFCLDCWAKYSYNEEKWESKQNTNTSEQEIPKIDLSKCGECKKPFIKGQEYWELRELTNKETQKIWNYCLVCWDKHSWKKKVWETQ